MFSQELRQLQSARATLTPWSSTLRILWHRAAAPAGHLQTAQQSDSTPKTSSKAHTPPWQQHSTLQRQASLTAAPWSSTLKQHPAATPACQLQNANVQPILANSFTIWGKTLAARHDLGVALSFPCAWTSKRCKVGSPNVTSLFGRFQLLL